MAERVACVQDLAQAHGEDGALVELPPIGPPILTNALPLPGFEYVCLSDGQLVDAATLLRGERRGAPYLPLDEAAELQRAELHRTGRQLAQEAEEVERALDAVQALPRAWARWHEREHEAVNDGFAHLERALALQKAAAGTRLVQMRAAADERAARATEQLRGCRRALARQRQALRRFEARVGVPADGEGAADGDAWQGRMCVAWPGLASALDALGAPCEAWAEGEGGSPQPCEEAKATPSRAEPAADAEAAAPFALRARRRPAVEASPAGDTPSPASTFAPLPTPASPPQPSAFDSAAAVRLFVACVGAGAAAGKAAAGEAAAVEAAAVEAAAVEAAAEVEQQADTARSYEIARCDLLVEQQAEITRLHRQLAEQGKLLDAAQAQLAAPRLPGWTPPNGPAGTCPNKATGGGRSSLVKMTSTGRPHRFWESREHARASLFSVLFGPTKKSNRRRAGVLVLYVGSRGSRGHRARLAGPAPGRCGPEFVAGRLRRHLDQRERLLVPDHVPDGPVPRGHVQVRCRGRSS